MAEAMAMAGKRSSLPSSVGAADEGVLASNEALANTENMAESVV